ncbi:MAG TPA: anthranilate synthase component I family protein [Methanoregulaceae archaeon]|nr:anthranilate synthase component I family protein [Methanoregulaceae archaeon]
MKEVEERLRTLVRGLDGPRFVPVSRPLPLGGRSPVRLYEALRGRTGFLLESVEGPGGQARYSCVGPDPALTLELCDDGCVLSGPRELVELAEGVDGRGVAGTLRAALSRFRGVDLPVPRFALGFVGSFAYEFATALFRDSPVGPRRAAAGPLARLHLATDRLVIDHADRTCHIVTAPLVHPGDDPDGVLARVERNLGHLETAFLSVSPGDPAPPGADTRLPGGATHPDRAGFEDAVAKAIGHVHAGDCLQVVLSRRIDLPFLGDPVTVYRELRAGTPGPYLFLIEEKDRTIVGSSPEMLVQVEGRRVTTVPIAGTRPRGADRGDDERLARELLADPKERAEHLMLVDLARSDLGRVCETGTVTVERFMAVEKYSSVQHMVSTVTGTLKNGLDRLDALAAVYPAGTVSGAPRLRAMELVEALEDEPRGVYAGAIGHLDLVGNDLDLAIAIRTAVIQNGTASVQVGAGIVADSVPSREYAETEVKASGILRALAAGAGGAA